MCCDDDIIDLGCWQSCDSIKTLIEIEYEGYFRISYNFNGAIDNRRFKGTIDNGKLVLPAGLFNEDYVTRFELFDDEKVKIGCYKVKIYPTQEYVQKSIIPIVTASDYNCSEGNELQLPSPESSVTFALRFEFTAEDQLRLLNDGSKFRIGFEGFGEFNVTNLTAGLLFNGSFEVDDINALTIPFGCDIEILVESCPSEIVIKLISYSNMKDENLIFNIPTQIIYD